MSWRPDYTPATGGLDFDPISQALPARLDGRPAAWVSENSLACVDTVERQPGRVGWLRKLVATTATVAAITAGIEAIPHVPGHNQAALTTEIVITDAETGISDLFSPANPGPTCTSLLLHYGLGNDLFKADQSPSWYASVWPSSRALYALYVTSLLPGQSGYFQEFENRLQAVTENYLTPQQNGPSYSQGPDAFRDTSTELLNDDAQWMAQLHMLAYNRTGDPSHLAMAEGIFKLAISQWDTRNGGGVPWPLEGYGESDYVRAVVSNAPLVFLGVDIYKKTGDAYYLRAGERVNAWLQNTLQDKHNQFLDFDHIKSNGKVIPNIYTYTQGIAAAAEAALATVDSKKYSLQAAVNKLNYDIDYFHAHHTYGNSAFDSIWIGSAMWVASKVNDTALIARVQQSLREASAAEPKNPDDLLLFAGNVTLRSFALLPVRQYGELMPG